MDAPRDRRRRGASRTALLLATSVAACGGTRSTPAKPALGPAEFAELDDLGGPAGAGPSGPSGPREPARTARAAAAPTLVAGHADARYEFVIPPGLRRLRGVLAEGHDPRELSAAGPDGVGLPRGGAVWLDVIVVFSDPLGLGLDPSAIAAAERERIVSMYGEGIRERYPSARPARLVSIDGQLAIHIELPRVEMPDRPVRSGRHYLILDGGATASVDCLWTKANAEQMSAACNALAASVRRVTSAR